MNTLDHQIQAILDRNARVEAEKAWEVSGYRRLWIAFLTYITACAFLWSVGLPKFWLQALVPTGGYLLSTLSLSWLKVRWMRRRGE